MKAMAMMVLVMVGLGGLLPASPPARAQSPVQGLEAKRYRNADGVEVLTSRALPPAPAPTPGVAAGPASASGASGGAGSPAAAGRSGTPGLLPAGGAPAIRVAPQDQAARDRDRLAILNGELMLEAQALSTKRQALNSPRAGLDLTSVQVQALRDDVARHEENIRALNREIRRMPVPGAMALKTAGGAIP